MPGTESLWYKDAVFYEVYVRGFYDANGDGDGDLIGLTSKLDYLQELGVDCLWLMPIYASPLKDDGYDIADFRQIHPTIGTVADFEALTKAAHCPRHPDHRRPRRQPHVRSASLVPGGPARPEFAQAQLLRLERHRPGLQGDADHLPRHRDLQLDLGPAGPAVLLAPLLQPSARPQLRQPGRPPGDARHHGVLARPRHRRLPGRRRALPLRARGDQLREPARDPRLPEEDAGIRGHALPGHAAARRGEPVAERPAPLLRQRRRVPHGVQLPADAPALHGHPPRGQPAHHRDHEPDARDPALLPVGPVPPQPRRADAGDGHRRGARLHVYRICQGPADAAQPGHPPAAGAR